MEYFERLESRMLLSADPGSSLATAMSLGYLSGARSFVESVSPRDRSDYYRLGLSGTGNFNLTLSGLAADANLELLNRNGSVIARSAKTGRNIERVSVSLKRGTYFVRVVSANRLVRTAYTLKMQADLNWGNAVNGSSRLPVGLVWANGSTRSINPSAETWVVIHGWEGSPESLSVVSDALQHHSKSYQVLALNWSKPAAEARFTAFDWVPAVAQFAAAKLAQWGVPSSKINLVGHSMGGYVAGELAGDVSGGVNRIVALDPATEWPLTWVDYAGNSQYSVAFIGSFMSTEQAATTADATFHMDVGDFNSVFSHMNVVDLYASMIAANNTASPDRVSSLFAPERMAPGVVQPWKINAYSGGYEGTLVGREAEGRWLPATLTYKSDASGAEVTVRA